MIDLPSDSPRFLISRMSAIGDTILTLPVLCALRDRFPKAHITWIVERKSAGVVEGHSDLDELIVLDRLWFKSPSRLREVRKRLRESKFDVTVDAQSKFKSALACWLSGAAVRIGCKGKYGQECSTLLNNTLIEPHKPHLVDRTLDLLQPLGINLPAVNFRLPAQSEDVESIDAFIKAAHLGCGFVVINPGAGWDSRLWPIERYGRVARTLGEQQNMPSVVAWAGERERQWAETIVAESGGHALPAPKTSLGALAALLDRSLMYIGNDTGPMHMAVAVNTPCVCLHGPTLPENSGPHGPQHIPIIERHEAGNSRQRRRAGNEAMRLIQVDRVVQACEEILQRDQANSYAA
jgi:heptosyltransferase-1